MNVTDQCAALAVSETAKTKGLNLSHPRYTLSITKHLRWSRALPIGWTSPREYPRLHGAEGRFLAAGRAWPTTLQTGTVVVGEGPVRSVGLPDDFRVLGSFRGGRRHFRIVRSGLGGRSRSRDAGFVLRGGGV